MTNLLRILYFLGSGLRRLSWHPIKLRSYQEKRLKAVIKYAYDYVPFYHEKFKEARISPSDIKHIDDLQKIPVVTKDDLRKEDPSRLVSIHYDYEKLIVQRTSGSTGTPFKSYIRSPEEDWRKAIYMRANISCGQRPRDRWAFITDPRHYKDTTNIQYKFGIYAQRCIPIFSGVREQIQVIQDMKPDVIDGYSGAIFLMAKELGKTGIDDVRPRMIFGSSDLMDAPSIKTIEGVFHAPYYDQVGCSEVDRTAWQCPEKIGYHMDVDSVITQFVDPYGSDVSPGERGEITYTSLFNYAMPFIRYSTGDVGIPSREECTCGRNLPLMDVIEGRKDSFIVLHDGNIISPRALTVTMSTFPYYDDIDQFRIIQRKVDQFEIYLKMKRNNYDENDIKHKLEEYFFKLLNISKNETKVNINFVQNIPLSKTGRLMAVYSELNAL